MDASSLLAVALDVDGARQLAAQRSIGCGAANAAEYEGFGVARFDFGFMGAVFGVSRFGCMHLEVDAQAHGDCFGDVAVEGYG